MFVDKLNNMLPLQKKVLVEGENYNGYKNRLMGEKVT